MKAYNATTGKEISSEIEKADTFMSRFLGLMPRKSLGEQEGLWLDPCNSIHMFFMSFPIDAVFLDKDNNVVHILENFKPWRISPFIRRASSVLELPAERSKGRIFLGDKIEFRN
ncbi:MAG: DUF192 domain-containing protein [Elusimicrobiales bacterium]|nr:DUF192 domain-containing protein [Elusimicrobiales bacterium]